MKAVSSLELARRIAAMFGKGFASERTDPLTAKAEADTIGQIAQWLDDWRVSE